MSTSTFRWRVLLISNILLGIGGLVLIALIALGIANPPLGSLQWETNSIDGWTSHELENMTVYDAPVNLSAGINIESVISLQISARNTGSSDSAWGIDMYHGSLPVTILIDNQGYYSIYPRDPIWKEFPHIQPGQMNTITLTANARGKAQLRINDELVIETQFDATLSDWKFATYREPQLTQLHIAVYHE